MRLSFTKCKHGFTKQRCQKTRKPTVNFEHINTRKQFALQFVHKAMEEDTNKNT